MEINNTEDLAKCVDNRIKTIENLDLMGFESHEMIKKMYLVDLTLISVYLHKISEK